MSKKLRTYDDDVGDGDGDDEIIRAPHDGAGAIHHAHQGAGRSNHFHGLNSKQIKENESRGTQRNTTRTIHDERK